MFCVPILAKHAARLQAHKKHNTYVYVYMYVFNTTTMDGSCKRHKPQQLFDGRRIHNWLSTRARWKQNKYKYIYS